MFVGEIFMILKYRTLFPSTVLLQNTIFFFIQKGAVLASY